ncbi:ribonuclease P/MRP protein subunit POP5 [Polistes fuscatus]|uniref:ribonuclease P/MRP protein subunit POP5 n=1 Tax=Polistes fuscatus TaxID=30207 RepID=UPI001CA949BB|nr:ribonuclease P/MRP protein subunit POP5 [Polistes fuscatus]
MVRFKHRYFAVEIEIMNNKNKSLKPTALLNAIKKKIQQLYGDYGLAAASIGLLTKYYNSSTKIAFVRTRHGPHRFILNALPLITEIDHQTAKVNIIYIGATIKHCFLNVRRYQQKKLEEVWGTLKTDHQRKEMLRVLNSTISVKDFNKQ